MSDNDESTGPQLEPWFSEAPRPRKRAEAETVPVDTVFGGPDAVGTPIEQMTEVIPRIRASPTTRATTTMASTTTD